MKWKKSMVIESRDVDPDPDWIRIQHFVDPDPHWESGSRIRIPGQEN
jgi:hypothetical protein